MNKITQGKKVCTVVSIGLVFGPQRWIYINKKMWGEIIQKMYKGCFFFFMIILRGGSGGFFFLAAAQFHSWSQTETSHARQYHRRLPQRRIWHQCRRRRPIYPTTCLPMFSAGSPARSLAALRRVCKGWRAIVDEQEPLLPLRRFGRLLRELSRPLHAALLRPAGGGAGVPSDRRPVRLHRAKVHLDYKVPSSSLIPPCQSTTRCCWLLVSHRWWWRPPSEGNWAMPGDWWSGHTIPVDMARVLI